MKTDKQKELLLEQLRKTPIVEICCGKASVSRATYYRWRNEDESFKKMSDEAIKDGELFINDMSESQVISLIKDKNWQSISFWLRYHHPKYANKIEVEANIRNINEELSPEQQEIVKEALRLASLNQEKHENQSE